MIKKLTLVDAAEYFGISKEAIHNRIRRGSLESIIENGQKMVLISKEAKVKTTRSTSRAKTPDDRYYKLLEEQNRSLQERVSLLEGETRNLRDQKELMLVQEREKIEQVYRDKDEQLKNVLTTLSQQFMLNTPVELKEESIEAVEVEMIEEKKSATPPISLKKFLKSSKFSEKKQAKIKAKFKKRAKKDERIIRVGSKIYVEPSKYDYSDLIF
jgi:predicted DNA-binding protein YlxM (UPF0122 family)